MADIPRLLLAAPASGSGKTTLAMGLLRALLDRGLRPAAFKCGPDYIDPLFHREILGVSGYNLDLFFADPGVVRGLLRRGAEGADIAVIEGVMGYYDGIGDTDRASSWRVAAETGAPAVLVVRSRGASLTLAAQIRGLAAFREKSQLRGIILNGCGETAFSRLAPVLARETGLTVFGHVPDLPAASLESRHLGLVTPEGIESLREKIAILSEAVRKSVDLDALLETARSAPPLKGELPPVSRVADQPVRIAIARDEAFCFYYRENIELLEALGAEPVFFSPLRDAALPGGIGGLYIGGGYPELHAPALAANRALRGCVREAVASGLPTLAECGGFLYLLDKLEDERGGRHPMAGALPGAGFNARSSRRFGYVDVEALGDNLLCAAGESVRGHEFHYWDSTENGNACIARKPSGNRAWECVQAGRALFAGFPHLYFWSNPGCAARFVRAAREFAGGERAT